MSIAKPILAAFAASGSDPAWSGQTKDQSHEVGASSSVGVQVTPETLNI